MQTDDRIGIGIASTSPLIDANSADEKSRRERNREQYPDENEGIYHQVADVVAERENVLGNGHLRPVFHSVEKALGELPVGRSAGNYRNQGARSFGQKAGGLETGHLFHGDLGG